MRQTLEQSGSRALRNGRYRTIVLVVLCGFLVLDGSLAPPPAGSEAEPVAAAPVAPAGTRIGPADIADVLRTWNASLDDHTVSRIAHAVDRYSRHYRLEPELVTAVIIVESSVRPWAYSPKGAIGLMQVMPHMIQPLGLAGNPATIESNIEAGCWILAHNIERLGEERGISAYFWGSNIRSLAYLEKVQEARETIRRRPS